MSGAKGKSGGVREGAGRPPKEKKPLKVGKKNKPLLFLLDVMNDLEADPQLRVRAAVAAAQYVHTKREHGGKKEELERAAKKAGERKFRPAAAPKLVVVNS